MKANRAYHLTVARGGRAGRWARGGWVRVTDPGRHDLIEVVAVAENEPILWWELPATEASRLAARLRSDLAAMEAGEFLALWDGADGADQ